MKICLVSQEYPPETAWGGIGTTTWTKAHAVARLGHEVHVLTRAADQGPEGRIERDGNVIVHRMQPPGFEFPIFGRSLYALGYTWHVLRRLHQLMEKIEFDLVDFPEFGGEGFAYQLDRTRWNWLPVVVQLHGPLSMFVEYMDWPARGCRFERFGTFMERLCIEQADAVMSCSSSLADLTSRHYQIARETIDVVHSGVDTELFKPDAAGRALASRPTVLFVGNIIENKGVHIVFEAVLLLRARYPDIQLRILGRIPEDGELMQRLRGRLAAENAEKHVEFAGFVPTVALPASYHAAHVFCAPAAEFEALGNVYLEAMACGCPVVASTAGGGPEAVTDGVAGLLVPPNDVSATAAALDRLLGDAAQRRRMGTAGRQRIEEYFAMDHFAERILAVYEKAIARSEQHPERWEDIRE